MSQSLGHGQRQKWLELRRGTVVRNVLVIGVRNGDGGNNKVNDSNSSNSNNNNDDDGGTYSDKSVRAISSRPQYSLPQSQTCTVLPRGYCGKKNGRL